MKMRTLGRTGIRVSPYSRDVLRPSPAGRRVPSMLDADFRPLNGSRHGQCALVSGGTANRRDASPRPVASWRPTVPSSCRAPPRMKEAATASRAHRERQAFASRMPVALATALRVLLILAAVLVVMGIFGSVFGGGDKKDDKPAAAAATTTATTTQATTTRPTTTSAVPSRRPLHRPRPHRRRRPLPRRRDPRFPLPTRAAPRRTKRSWPSSSQGSPRPAFPSSMAR